MKTADRSSRPRALRPPRVETAAGGSSDVVSGKSSTNLSMLAAKMRWLRLKASMTLHELSDRSGISQSTLSKIENGQLSPTYEKIIGLAKGLKVDISELFVGATGSGASGRRGVSRAGNAIQHTTAQYDYEVLCSDMSGKQFVPLKTRIKAHSIHDFSEIPKHEGEEFVYVLSGSIVLHSEFYQPLTLNPGDSCYFDSNMGHALVSGTDVDAEILWVCSKTVGIDHAP